MFSGKNSEKEFEILNEEMEVIAEFDRHSDCVHFLKSVQWFHGKCNVRRDRRFASAPEKCGWTIRAFIEIAA